MKFFILTDGKKYKTVPEIDSDGVFLEPEDFNKDGWTYHGSWCIKDDNGKRHSFSGPSHYNAVTKKYYWYINGIMMGKEFLAWLSSCGIDFVNPSDNDTTLIKLRWGNSERVN